MPPLIPQLTAEEQLRYGRHLNLPDVGTAGQLRLKQSSVLLVGLGGLGSPCALYLAAAGVVRLGLMDGDTVDRSNLQRQVLYGESDVGRLKVEAARDRLRALNPGLQTDLFPEHLTAAHALERLAPYDVIVDGTDNFAARYLINDACVLLGKPDVHGSVFRMEGQASVFWAARGPCYRCLYPEPPPAGAVPDCAEGGVLGVLPGLIGLLQATETLKLILGIGQPLLGRLLLYHASGMKLRELKLEKDPHCPVCGASPTITTLREEAPVCSTHQGAPTMPDVTVHELKKELDAGRDLFLLDVREPREFALGALPGGVLIPMGEIPARLQEIPAHRDIVCYCRSGGRSARVVNFLAQNGFTRIRNLTGGTLAWSDQIDPTLPKY
jgi:molybdopterin/thiamine biosynthesis adenylyltransferase/rhodanese-related sulfurtransferase